MPSLVELGEVGIKSLGGDGAVCCPKVGQHGEGCYVAESDFAIFKDAEETVRASFEKLLAESTIDTVVRAESCHSRKVGAVGFGDLWASGTDGVDRCGTGMDRDGKNGIGERSVASRLHREDEMTEKAIATGGVDRGGVAVELKLSLLKRRMGWNGRTTGNHRECCQWERREQ